MSEVLGTETPKLSGLRARCAPLAVGSPRFGNPRHAALARQHGALAAWLEALAAGPAAAAASVSGDFAVGLHTWDGHSFIAVDRFARHSLCFRVVDRQLRFALRADELADGSTPIDPQAILDYLWFHAIPSPRTIYRDVHRLPPGHYALMKEGKLEVAPYWVPQFAPAAGKPDFDALRNEFRGLLRDAVATQLDGSRPACYLSGGTDSSTVAGMIREACGQPAASYSIGFEAEGYDEMAYARLAAGHFGTEHHEYYVTPADLMHSIPQVAAHYDQPFGNSSAVPAYYCAGMARSDGATRLLAGDGGDELFGGNARYAKQRVFDAYQRVPAALRRGLLEPLLQRSPMGALPLLRKGRSYIEQARQPMPDRLALYNLLPRLGLREALGTGLLAQVVEDAPAAHQRRVWAQARGGDAVDRALAFDWRYTLAENDLPKVRGSAELAGVDVGFPLLDERLLEFSLRLPPHYKLRGLKLRWFFKEALRGFLPEAIIAKKKHGFGLPFGVWATRHPALQALARESLHGLADRGVVRPAFVAKLLREQLPAHPGYYGEMVWILMMLEQWLRRHAPGYRVA